MSASLRQEVSERIERLEIPWNRDGIDPYGISKAHLATLLQSIGWLYRSYFRVEATGIERVPRHGRAMIVGNHSGGYALDAILVMAACFFELEPPRLCQGMADKFLSRLPFAAIWSNKTGHFTGLPEHAARLLREGRLLMVFPEGARGTAKLFRDRYTLRRFGTGFLRLSLETDTPIVPVAFSGVAEAVPTIANLRGLGKLIGVPYVPITPYLLPVPLPRRIKIQFGPAITPSGRSDDDDAQIEKQVEVVKSAIAELLEGMRHK